MTRNIHDPCPENTSLGRWDWSPLKSENPWPVAVDTHGSNSHHESCVRRLKSAPHYIEPSSSQPRPTYSRTLARIHRLAPLPQSTLRGPTLVATSH